MVEEKHLLLEQLKEFFDFGSYVHIVCSSYHYNGWVVGMDDTHIKFKDKKTNSIMIFRISNLALIELNKRGEDE